MGTWNRLIAVRGEVGGQDWIKEDEGISKKKKYIYIIHTDNSVIVARRKQGGGWVEMGKVWGQWGQQKSIHTIESS